MYSNKIIKRGVYTLDVGQPVNHKATISGTINEVSNSDKSILVYDRDSGHLIASTMVDRTTRTWEVGVDPGQSDGSMFIVCRDESEEFNGDIYDRVSLCTKEYAVPAGVLNTTYWPSYDLIHTAITPLGTHDTYNIELQELKGDIQKIKVDTTQGVGGNINSETEVVDAVKFYDANNNEINNAITNNSVLVNGYSTIVDKTARNSLLKKYTLDILNTDHEICFPEIRGDLWYDHYSGGIISYVGQNSLDNKTVAPGRYGEPCLTFGENPGSAELGSGESCIEYPVKWTQGAETVVASFFVNLAYYYISSSYPGFIEFSGTYYDNSNRECYVSFGMGSQCRITTNNRPYIPSNTKSICSFHRINTSSYTYTHVNSTVHDWVETPWHHVLLVWTGSSIQVYWNGDQVINQSVSMPNKKLYNLQLILGRRNLNCSSGRISGLRVFSDFIPDSTQLNTLALEKPIIDTEVTSIRGIQDDGYVTYLGGIPYKPVSDYLYGWHTETGLNDFTSTVYTYADEDNIVNVLSKTPVLGKDYVFFTKERTSSDNVTFLGTRPDIDMTQTMPYSASTKSDILVRFKAILAGCILCIGDYGLAKDKFINVYIDSGGNLSIYWPRAPQMNDYITSYISKPSGDTFFNKWLTLELLSENVQEEIEVNGVVQNVSNRKRGYKLYSDTTVYADQPCVLDGNITEYTLGQIVIGGYRQNTSSYIGDGSGFKGMVSDVKICASGSKCGTVQKWFKFGYERDGLAGLNIREEYNLTLGPGYDKQKLVPYHYYGANYTPSESIFQVSPKANTDKEALYNNENGWTIAGYYNLVTRDYLENAASYDYYMVRLYNFYTLQYRQGSYNISASSSLKTNAYSGTNTKEHKFANTAGPWHSVVHTVRPNRGWMFNAIYNVDTVPIKVLPYISKTSIGTDSNALCLDSTFNSSYKNVYSLDKFKVYKAGFSNDMIRSVSQNYEGKAYKNDMQVAFYCQKNAYPLYAGLDVSSIKIDGEDNGQTLVFAITNNDIDYYIFKNAWIKIMTRENNTWKYLGSSGWTNSNGTKWNTMALAMQVQANQMSKGVVNSLTPANIASWYDKNIGVINWAVGMKCDGSISPYVRNILVNGLKVWVSPIINLSDFSNTDYHSCVYLSKQLSVGEESGIKLYSHISNTAGWVELANFEEVPGIIKDSENAGSIQFMATFDPSKRNGREPCMLNIKAGDLKAIYAKDYQDPSGN